jgi:hypothetical protein
MMDVIGHEWPVLPNCVFTEEKFVTLCKNTYQNLSILFSPLILLDDLHTSPEKSFWKLWKNLNLPKNKLEILSFGSTYFIWKFKGKKTPIDYVYAKIKGY